MCDAELPRAYRTLGAVLPFAPVATPVRHAEGRRSLGGPDAVLLLAPPTATVRHTKRRISQVQRGMSEVKMCRC